MNKELLDNWVENGLAKHNLGDGAWGWSQLGVDSISPLQRMLLSSLLYGEELERWQLEMLPKEFNTNGFYSKEE